MLVYTSVRVWTPRYYRLVNQLSPGWNRHSIERARKRIVIRDLYALPRKGTVVFGVSSYIHIYIYTVYRYRIEWK
jgi:hypothetical protein